MDEAAERARATKAEAALAKAEAQRDESVALLAKLTAQRDALGAQRDEARGLAETYRLAFSPATMTAADFVRCHRFPWEVE